MSLFGAPSKPGGSEKQFSLLAGVVKDFDQCLC